MLHHKKIPSSGFALLITLVIISVVISIGITLIDLTIKQLRLANSSKDSETAFHAANAGVECVRYWRIASSTEFETGLAGGVPIRCFNESAVNSTPTQLVAGSVFQHDFEISWGPTNARRCSKVKMITISSDPTSAGVTYNGIQSIILGYPQNSKTCIAGGRCSIISVQGFNRACGSITELGTIQREVLLDL
jgi:hypothetical protein